VGLDSVAVNRRNLPRTRIGRRRRVAARTALYVSLVLVGGLLAGVYYLMLPSLEFGMMTAWSGIDWESRREVQLLREYVRIDTSPKGDTREGIDWVAEKLRGMGVEPHIEQVGDAANLWAIIEGEQRGAVVLHHHVDVEAVVNLEDWTQRPFHGDVEGPWIYGRGAFDMKSIAIAQLLAVERLVASGRRPERSVIVLVTNGEERGSDLGTRWILREHPELVERFAVVLTEGGAVEGRTQESFKFWGTEFAQKRLLVAWFCHADRERVAALESEMLAEGGFFSPPELVPEAATFFAAYAPTRDAAPLRELLSDPRALVRDPVAFADLSSHLRSHFRNEARPQWLRRRGDAWALRVHVLLLPGEDPEQALAELFPPWRTHGLKMEVFDEAGAGHGSPIDHWAFEGIGEVLAEHHPDVPHGPLFLPSTLTDARFLRAAGVPTFGFSPFAVLTPEVLQQRAYGTVNERMSLPGFSEGVELYADVLERLAG